ncbi:MAG: glycosyltransferase [bacterium]|nr:glycosyltransferase [bacterium]
MKVLQIGTDRSIFDPNSVSASRMREYGKRFGELEIIVFSLRKPRMPVVRLGENVRVSPTDSFSRVLYVLDAVWIGLALPKPDVISVQDPFEAGIAGWIIARLRGVSLHVQVHTDFLSPEYARHSSLNWLRVLVAGFVLRRADRIRVVSERVKNSIGKKYHLRATVTVLPIFVDVGRFRNVRPDESLTKRFSEFRTKLLVVSRLEPEKGVELAIRAFASSAPKDACLIIVGEGSEKASLARLAKTLGLSNRVFFEGSAAPIKYYKLANLILATSLYEGYGMVIIEALASGVPVLSTDVGIAREAGAIIAPREKFSEALAGWFKNAPPVVAAGQATRSADSPVDGPRTGELKGYPYRSLDEYVQAYCSDILSCL